MYHTHLKGSRLPVPRGFPDPEEFRYHLLLSGDGNHARMELLVPEDEDAEILQNTGNSTQRHIP